MCSLKTLKAIQMLDNKAGEVSGNVHFENPERVKFE
jgi:hypothetical protein